MAREAGILIVGGGFAGVALARRLERRLPRERPIVLLNRDNHITYTPLLPEVVAASVLPGQVLAPLRLMLRRTQVRMVEVEGIDLARREVHYGGEGPGVLPFDQLVLACGVVPNLALAPGMDRYALPLVTVGDALYMRNRIMARLEQATLQPDEPRSRWLTTFIVVGGGFSGVEVAGALLDFLPASLRYYPELRAHGVRVLLVHNQEGLLPELPRGLGERALQKMRRMGLEVHLNALVEEVDARGVRLGDGRRLEGATIITTAGTAPAPLIEALPVPKVKGRITTAADMSVPDWPGVWAIGDCAAVPNAFDGQLSPPTAQFATRQAAQLAANIDAHLRNRPTRPFSYRAVGQLASIGRNKAVASIYGLHIDGLLAWLLWRGVYLLKMPTLARKVRLLLAWSWDAMSPPDITYLRFGRSQGQKDGADPEQRGR